MGDLDTFLPGDLTVNDGRKVFQLLASQYAWAKQNGTPDILTWTAPNDGLPHRVALFYSQDVTTAETGGQVNFSWTFNGAAGAQTVVAGSSAVGVTHNYANRIEFIVDANATVTLQQVTALTAGATTVSAELWGA